MSRNRTIDDEVDVVNEKFGDAEDMSDRSEATSIPSHPGDVKSSPAMPHDSNDEPLNESPQDPEGFLGKVLSKTRSCNSIPDPGPPPDGGFRAWAQVLAGHLTVLNTWGYINSFGVFQTYYVTALNQTPSAISWVGSVQVFLLFFIGTFSGRATDAGLFRVVYLAGSFFLVLGVFMTSLSTRYWQLFLAQGICTGIGNGLIFCPILSLSSTYFNKKRSFAISIAAAGTAPGGVIYPVIVQQLLPRIGFAWTVRVIGFIMLTIQIVSFALAKPRLPPRRSGPLVEWNAFGEKPYLLFCIGMFFIFWALYFAFYYIGAFGRDILHVSQTDSINLLLIMNGVGFFGRIIPGFIADRYTGPLNTIIPFAAISGLLLYCWTAVSSQTGLVLFGIFYGIFAAGIQSLFPATLASLTTDIKKTGVRIGMCFSVISFACLTGPPLAGALIQRDGGRYLYAQMFAGSSMVAGCLTLVSARVAKSRWKKEKV